MKIINVKLAMVNGQLTMENGKNLDSCFRRNDRGSLSP